MQAPRLLPSWHHSPPHTLRARSNMPSESFWARIKHSRSHAFKGSVLRPSANGRTGRFPPARILPSPSPWIVKTTHRRYSTLSAPCRLLPQWESSPQAKRPTRAGGAFAQALAALKTHLNRPNGFRLRSLSENTFVRSGASRENAWRRHRVLRRAPTSLGSNLWPSSCA